jgi:hypothetical protein
MPITEQQYRRWSHDTASPWVSSGNNIGVQELVGLAAEEVADYLDTFLEPTSVASEEHRVYLKVRHIMGAATEARYRTTLNRRRLLTDYTITVTWVHKELCSCTETTCAGCATVLNARQSKLDLSACSVGAGGCGCFTTSEYVTARISYSAGFETLPTKLVRAVALLARHDAKELIVGDGAMDDDLPWGAPQIQRTDLGLFRTYDSPSKYASGDQGISAFGRQYLGIEVQRLCAPYRVFDVDQI